MVSIRVKLNHAGNQSQQFSGRYQYQLGDKRAYHPGKDHINYITPEEALTSLAQNNIISHHGKERIDKYKHKDRRKTVYYCRKAACRSPESGIEITRIQ